MPHHLPTSSALDNVDGVEGGLLGLANVKWGRDISTGGLILIDEWI